MDWLIHRVLTSERYNESMRDLEEWWSMDDLSEAHMYLDAVQEATDEARRARERK